MASQQRSCMRASVRATAIAGAISLTPCGGSSSDPETTCSASSPGPAAFVAQSGASATLRVTDASSPFQGAELQNPACAVASGKFQIQFGYAAAPPKPLNAAAPGSGGRIISKTLVPGKDRAGTFDAAPSLTVPYDKSQRQAGAIPTVLHCGETAGDYGAMAVVAHDAARGTVTFKTVHFSCNGLAVVPGLGKRVRVPAGGSTTSVVTLGTDTTMRPSAAAFWLGNLASYSDPAGSCLGMCSFADWFVERAKVPLAAGKGLSSLYREGDAKSADDDVAVQGLIVRAHAASSPVWAQRQAEQFSKLTQDELATQLIQAMKLIGKPHLSTGRWCHGPVWKV